MNNPWTQHLIEAEALHASANNTVIFDCRFDLMNPDAGRKLYNEGHIPGAYFLDLNQDLSSPVSLHGGRHPFPDLQSFAEKLANCGVNDDTTVIAYDDNKSAFASRLWYLCHHIGHVRVKILNGGLSAWKRANLPINIEVPTAQQGIIGLVPPSGNIIGYQEMKALSEKHPERIVLVDSREEARYLGHVEPIDPIAGHIPGACNLPWMNALDEQGVFLPVEKQRVRWKPILQDDDEPVIYCGSGVTACVNLFSLALIGRNDAKLYAGSWSDWCSHQR